ncbi:MAG: 2-oxoacid:acceptor oxidoreductase family protein [Candidatus Helarchaeota archaeon]
MSSTNEYGLTSIRFHARGGQGGVTAAQLVVYAYNGPAKCFPKFGAERMGSPTEAYAKVSQDPDAIRSNEQVYAPRYVCILDDTLLQDVCVTNGLPPGGWLIINSVKSVDVLREYTDRKDINYAIIDATGLAIEKLGRPITNTAILGALSKVSGLFSIKDLEHAIEFQFRGSLVQKNIDLIRAVYDSVKIYKVDIEYDPKSAEKPEWNHLELNYQGAKDYEIGAVWYTPGASIKINTGSWGSYNIYYDPEHCIQCQRCFFVCPDMAIKREKQPNGEWHIVGTDMGHCKGCRLCVEVCPGKDGIKARSAKLKEEEAF